jgi:hypothetical protein
MILRSGEETVIQDFRPSTRFARLELDGRPLSRE